MNNGTTPAKTQMTAKDLFEGDKVKARFQEMLGERATGFITSVLQIVASNPLLKNAEPNSVYHAAAVAATLDLPLNNQLGFAWIVPYKKNYTDGVDEKGRPIWKSTVLAQFQIGYKGYIQLAQRTGEYLRINVIPVYRNQFKKWDSLREELTADFEIEGEGDVVGYCCFFKLINGFEKTTYWKIEKVKAHAKRYSQSYQEPEESTDNKPAKKANSPWSTEFDKMAMKTVLANTLKMWGILSIEMKKALKADQAVITNSETEDVDYVDGTAQVVDKEEERISLMIDDCKTIEELDNLYPDVTDSLMDKYMHKKSELSNVPAQPEIFDNVEVNGQETKSKNKGKTPRND